MATEASNREKLIELENELRERVKVERDEEIERAVDRIGKFLFILMTLNVKDCPTNIIFRT